MTGTGIVQGASVRVIPTELEGFYTETAKRLANRVGVITSIRDGIAFVTWGKRGNRGKEFQRPVRIRYLELVP